MNKKYWFAKKLNGEVIILTEKEALTHWEDNNISRRMRLSFIGTSDGSIYNKAMEEAKDIPETGLINREWDELPQEKKDKWTKYGNDPKDWKGEKGNPRKEFLKQKLEEEMEQARKNGVDTPNKLLNIMTPRGEKDEYGNPKRDEIISKLNINL